MSESKEQHISAPWILGGSAAWSEAAKDRGPVFTCDIREGTHLPVGTNQANARFIVKAVNSHETLIESLKSAHTWLAGLALLSPEINGLKEQIAQVDAALELAEKES